MLVQGVEGEKKTPKVLKWPRVRIIANWHKDIIGINLNLMVETESKLKKDHLEIVFTMLN